ncbi:hypothetical protein BV510_02375, partial [Mycolicibacterium diernhoferi]
EDEAVIVADGPFDLAAAERLGVPEILVTYGSEGCDIYRDGTVATGVTTFLPDRSSAATSSGSGISGA